MATPGLGGLEDWLAGWLAGRLADREAVTADWPRRDRPFSVCQALPCFCPALPSFALLLLLLHIASECDVRRFCILCSLPVLVLVLWFFFLDTYY